MIALDAGIGAAKALVIDCNAASRATLTGMLRDFGVGSVIPVCRAQDGRSQIEKQHFDIVVCDYAFDSEPISGQDLMDDLRLAHLLPLSTVVIMISAEAGHSNVAEAAEAALDAYLLKPHTAEGLRCRLLQARQRKAALRDIFELVDKHNYAEAAELCQLRFDRRGPAWLHAARIGAELWLRLAKPVEAQRMFDAILQVGAVPWARLGIARSLQEEGNPAAARRTLESLLNEQPGYTDAYDVMSRVLLDQGLPEQSLAAARDAAALTPGSVARLVKLGLLAFLYGEPEEASKALALAARLGLNSRAFDLQGLVMLAILQFDRGDGRGVARSWSSMAAAHAKAPGSDRLRRFEATIGAMKSLLERQVAQSVALVRQLIDESLAPSFDFEAACNALSLLSRVSRDELHLPSLEQDVSVLASRFAVSRSTCDILVRASSADATLAAVIRDAYARICSEAEDAVSKSLNNQPGEAVHLLLKSAEKSLNGRLMDLARHTIERHASAIDDVARLRERTEALHKRYRSYGTQVMFTGAPGIRTLGGLTKS